MTSTALVTRLEAWKAQLQGWAADGKLVRAAQQALELEASPGTLQALVDQWSVGDFSGLPPINLLAADQMPGAAGAYALSTGTIYLNQAWLDTASDEMVIAVLTEELGHHLDGLLNAVDTEGDEGKHFASILTDYPDNSIEHGTHYSNNDDILIKSTGIAAEASALGGWPTRAYQFEDPAWGGGLSTTDTAEVPLSLWSGWSGGIAVVSDPLDPTLQAELELSNLPLNIPYELNASLRFHNYDYEEGPLDEESWWQDENPDSNSLIVAIESSRFFGDVRWEVARVSTSSNQAFDDWEIDAIDDYIIDSKSANLYFPSYPPLELTVPTLITGSNLDDGSLIWNGLREEAYYFSRYDYSKYDFFTLGQGDLLYLSPVWDGFYSYGTSLLYPILSLSAEKVSDSEVAVLAKDVGLLSFHYSGEGGEPAYNNPLELIDIDPAANSVAEDAAIGTPVGITALATDADSSASITGYSLTDNACGRFAIDTHTGVVTVAAALDFESGNSHTIKVFATSSDGSQKEGPFTVEVTVRTDVDADGNGFVDGSTTYKLVNGDKAIDLVNSKGQPQKSKPFWSAIKAIQDDSGFKVLIEGTQKLDDKFKIWNVNSEGVIQSKTAWTSGKQMMWQGYEEIFDQDLNADSVTGLYFVDADGNGFIDGSTTYKLVNGDKAIDLVNSKGQPQKSKPFWSAIKAIQDDSGFKVLIEGTQKLDGKFKIWNVNSEGVIQSKTAWASGKQMMWHGYEEIFDRDLNADSVTGLYLVDADGNGFVDGSTTYKLVNGDKAIDLVNSKGQPQKSKPFWSAIKAIQDDYGFKVLIEGTQKLDGKFKIWNVNSEGVIQSKTAWGSQNWIAKNGYDELFAINMDGNLGLGF